MVQAVTCLVGGETIPRSLQRLFDCAREAHRVACSRHGLKSWELFQEQYGGREEAILVLKKRGLCGDPVNSSKGGKASWERLEEQCGGRDGALDELERRGFENNSKGGRNCLARHGVNSKGQQVAAVHQTGSAKHHYTKY